MTIGERIRRLAEVAGISISKLAASAGIDRGALYSILSGKTANPGALTLQSIADVLDVSILALLDDEAYRSAMQSLFSRRYGFETADFKAAMIAG